MGNQFVFKLEVCLFFFQNSGCGVVQTNTCIISSLTGFNQSFTQNVNIITIMALRQYLYDKQHFSKKQAL